MWHVYVRKDIALVPNVAQTEAGYFLDTEPVRVAKLDDIQSLAAAIDQALAVGNPRIETPTRAAFPRPVILKPAGVKNWNAFVEKGACFTILREDAALELAETGRTEDGEWIDAPSLTQRLPASSSAFDIATRIVERASQRADLT